jgi:hypothetical protein
VKDTEKFAGKYLRWCPQSCARLRRHVYLHLDSYLCLDLNLDLNLNLYLYLFLNSFRQLSLKLFAASFDSMFVLKFRQL